MGINSLRKDRDVDIVLCIDATSSMGPCIENVRNNAKMFYKNLTDKLKSEYQSEVSSFRVQVIVFRDFECDSDAIIKSEFFELPSDTLRFEKFLNGIVPMGGGDYKESGIEAIYTAVNTSWCAVKDADRQIIVLFTDSDGIDFGEKKDHPGYTEICSEKDFMKAWACISDNSGRLRKRCRRLVMFAPPESIYEKKLYRSLENSIWCPVTPLKGMADISFEAITKLICASISAVS